MANGLAQWLGIQRPVPQYSPEEQELGPTDYELGDWQSGIAEEGAASGNPFYVPSRESLQTSSMGALRRALKMGQIEAQNAAYPRQVAGEYGLREAEIGAQGRVEAARAMAEAQAERIAQGQQFQVEQGERSRQFQAEQGNLNRQAQSGRQQVTQQGMGQRQQAGQQFTTQRDVALGKADDPDAPGIFGRIRALFGGGQPAAPQQQPSSNIAAMADHFRRQRPGADPQQLLQEIQQVEPDLTPAELQELAAYLQ